METLKDRPAVKSLIEKISREQNIKNHKIIEVKTNQKGEGYLGEIFMITVKDESSEKQLEIVIKAAFLDQKVREMAPIRISFQNEIYFYTKVYTTYNSFAEQHGIIKKLECVPKCLKVSIQDCEEMLALENLKISGFEIFDKKLILDEPHVKLIFKTYGSFHGYSFALKDQKFQEYQKITEGCYNVYNEFMKTEFFGKHLQDVTEKIQNLLIPGKDDKVIKKFQKYLGNNVTNIFANIVTENVEFSGILHGDCWSNNMMFKYTDTADGRKPVDMRLIDFQLIKVGSPVCDLSYCLYSGASKKIFDKLDEYLTIYYNSFAKTVTELGSDPKKLYPFDVLKEDWKKYSRFGMIMAFSILRMKMINKEDLIDLTDGFDKDELVDLFSNIKIDEQGYSDKIRGLLWHLAEIDAL